MLMYLVIKTPTMENYSTIVESLLIPEENLQDLKGFRALGSNAFVLTTRRQALERFYFLAAERNTL